MDRPDTFEALAAFIRTMAEDLSLDWAYDHFTDDDAPAVPFIVYLTPASANFAADARVYKTGQAVHLELYTDTKDPHLERQIEARLNEGQIVWNKTETWIATERLYEVLYTFTLIWKG